jgi:REP element-mobilizing transposase RayT
VAGNDWLLGDVEKEAFRRMMWQVADFSGVEVLTYCIMSNHFHLLIRVPCVDETSISNQELVRRYKVLYPKPDPLLEHTHQVVEEMLESGREDGKQMREWLLSRMHDLPCFMKCLKQRFSIWYNKTHGRFGTFWSERFKSLLVESNNESLRIVSAYIDLNPVRAGIVNDPKEYRFCGYAESVAGNCIAISGLRSVMALGSSVAALASYRLILFNRGYSPDKESSGSKRISSEQLIQVNQTGGKLPISEFLRCKCRYFSDGMILGSHEFVNSVFEDNRTYFGHARKTGARLMRGFGNLNMCVARDLSSPIH